MTSKPKNGAEQISMEEFEAYQNLLADDFSITMEYHSKEDSWDLTYSKDLSVMELTLCVTNLLKCLTPEQRLVVQLVANTALDLIENPDKQGIDDGN